MPLLAPTVWNFFTPNKWAKVLEQLERQKDLPLNSNIALDGKHGIGLYRANFIPRLTQPRQRFAVCPVQAIVLQRDHFVSPELIDEMPKWAEQFQRVEIDANHWAVLSQPKLVADYIRSFALERI